MFVSRNQVNGERKLVDTQSTKNSYQILKPKFTTKCCVKISNVLNTSINHRSVYIY